MNESNQSSWEPYVWMGALGGTIGTFVVVSIVAIFVLYRVGSENVGAMFVFMGVFGLAGGVIAGGGVGYVIYKLTSRRGTQPNAAARIAIGFGCLLTYALLAGLTGNRQFHPTFEIGYAIAVGGVAGLMSRAKTRSLPASPFQDRA